NAMMVEYFIRGLRLELQDAVIPLMCKIVEEAAQRAAILERTVQARQSGRTGSFQLLQQSTGDGPGCHVQKATDLGVAFRMRQPDPSRSALELAVSRRRVQNATEDTVAFRLPKAKGEGEQEASRPSSILEPHHNGVGSAPPAV
ncbi:hypothetical protein Taro_047155, partial [Colocasia esculenta]|nr:hypothetical protein [Colocasia esculenta]